MKRYDSYIDSGIQVLGKVPSSWKKSKFKFQHIEQEERVGEDSNEYDLLSLTKKGIILRDIESGKGKFPESFDTYKKVKKNDLIFCLYDIEETPRTVGLSELNGMITGSYKIFSSKDVITKFTYYTFLVIDDVKGLKPYYTGLRNVVRPETFKSLPFFIPSISEQQQIVSFLDTKTSLIDSLIEKTQQKIELLKEKRTSIINEVVTKGLNPNVEMKDSGVEWIGEIPSHWDFIRLKYLFSLEGGKDPKNIQNDDGEYPILGTGGEISRGSDYLYDKPTLLLGRKGTIDKPYLYESPFWVSDVMYYTIMKKDISPRYLNFLFKTIPFDYYRYGSTQPSMSRLDYESMYFPIPPSDERQEISNYIDEQTQLIDKTISIEEKRIELLKEYRQSLISEVVTGKRKVV